MNWQPIETAPFEKRVLLWCADLVAEWREPKRPKGVVFGRVVDYGDGERKAFGEGMSGDWTFTHWMPTPEGPAQGMALEEPRREGGSGA